MALIENKNIETNKYELIVSVDAQTFEGAVSRAFQKNNKSIAVPGFRKGKAPRKMVEKIYGEGVFFDDAINELYPIELQKAIEESKLEIVARPDVEILTISKEEGFTMKAILIVKPQVEISNYKGIKAAKEVKTVTDEMVDEKIDAMLARASRLTEVNDRAAALGDNVTFDFAGSVEDVPFEGGTATDFALELGSGQFIPGFEEQMVGKNLEEDFDVNVTFPEDYHSEDLKGKEAIFKCKIHSIKAKELPDLDDEFAKDVSEFDTLVELKDDTKVKLQETLDNEANTTYENTLIDSVIENLVAEIPNEMFEARIDEFVQDFSYRLQSQGLKLEDYIKYTGMEMDSFRKTFEEQATKQVKITLALEKIVELEDLTATPEEIAAEYEKLAENYKMEIDKIKAYIPEVQLISDIAKNKAVDLVRDAAVAE